MPCTTSRKPSTPRSSSSAPLTRAGWAASRPGSTGERLLHGAPCAVAVVPHGYRTRADQSIRRIGVAYDGSDEADAAVTAAVELSRALDAELEIIGVVAPEAYSATALMGGLSSATLREDIERSVQAGLDTVVAGLPADVTGESVRLAGDPADQLGEHSAGLDLMLAGSRGYGPLRSVLVGGVSGRLMRTVQCPMIVVPRGVAGAARRALRHRDRDRRVNVRRHASRLRSAGRRGLGR